ncbi:MAG: stage V sporulation protein B [Planctomycetota bacterium]|jgi:stage V sporulation protein B
MTDPKAESLEDDAQKIGRGALYLTGTKLWFMVSGYIIYFGLPRILGSGEEGKALFGKYQVAIFLASIANALAVQGTTQAIARFVGRGKVGGIRAAAIRLQTMLGGGAFLLLFFSAPYIAEHVYDDTSLTRPLQCSAFITLFYAFYGIYMGYLNGSREFAKQALVDFSFSTLKVIGVLCGAFFLKNALDPVSGPIVGWAGAALVVLVMGRVLCGPAKAGDDVSVKELFNFQIFTMLVAGAATAVAKTDLQVVKIGLAKFHDMPSAQVDAIAGEYSAAQVFATIPYQLVFAITFILFPLVTAASDNDREKLKGYVVQTTRYAAMIAGAIVPLFVACPERTLMVLFPPEFADGAPALRFLALGYFCYSVFFIMVSIITASGRPGVSFLLVAITFALQIACGAPLVAAMGANGAALGTMIAMFIGLLVANRFATKNFGQGVVCSVMIKIAVCGAIVGGVAHVLLARATLWGGHGVLANIGGTGIVSKLLTAGGFSALGVIYIFVLVKTKIFDDEDMQRFRKVLKRG